MSGARGCCGGCGSRSCRAQVLQCRCGGPWVESPVGAGPYGGQGWGEMPARRGCRGACSPRPGTVTPGCFLCSEFLALRSSYLCCGRAVVFNLAGRARSRSLRLRRTFRGCCGAGLGHTAGSHSSALHHSVLDLKTSPCTQH